MSESMQYRKANYPSGPCMPSRSPSPTKTADATIQAGHPLDARPRSADEGSANTNGPGACGPVAAQVMVMKPKSLTTCGDTAVA
ncbi:hypothetical protein [Streptomyces sp. NPDC085937]|uniref:hypothetical protein n=1 Tax=Streptomyces sp. NPDC085937 TaxID=3365742 RepID=UPI0037D8A054